MKDFRFRRLSEEDLEWARVMHNDPEVLMMLTDPHEVSPEEQISWFSGLQTSKSSQRWIIETIDKERIGLARIDQLDLHNKSVCLGLDIHKDFRGLGYARPIYRQWLSHFFLDMGLNRVWLLVAEYNQRARHIYNELGFREEGRQRAGLLKTGKFHDYIMMSILRDEYLARRILHG